MTVIKAIQSCGDFTDFANKKKVRLTHTNGRSEFINCKESPETSRARRGSLPGRQNQRAPQAFLMVQLKILSGTRAGTTWAARRFPVRIGRSLRPTFSSRNRVFGTTICSLISSGDAFILSAQPKVLAAVNGQAR